MWGTPLLSQGVCNHEDSDMSVPRVHKVQFQRNQAAPLKPEGHIPLDPWETGVTEAIREAARQAATPLRPLWWTPAFVQLVVAADGPRPERQFQIIVWVRPDAKGHCHVMAPLHMIERFT